VAWPLVIGIQVFQHGDRVSQERGQTLPVAAAAVIAWAKFPALRRAGHQRTSAGAGPGSRPGTGANAAARAARTWAGPATMAGAAVREEAGT
jgi:hypothetical protein